MSEFVYEDRGYVTPCRIWQGATRGRERVLYGVRRRDGRLVAVHRDEWERAFGPIPDGLKLLHRCDVGVCAELSHLFLGTQSDNIRDALAKGRLVTPEAVGEANSNARLTLTQVREIRALVALPRGELAARYGVSRRQIGHILSGSRWKEAA